MNVIVIRRPNHKRKILRWLFLLLCFVGLFFLIYLGLTAPKLFYRIVDEENVAITGYRGNIKNVVIQSEYRGIPVTFVYEQAFKNNPWIESVEIPGTVQWIDFQAFYNCPNLQEVELKEGVEDIWDQAFAQCTSLASITLPASLESIHDLAFSGCSGLITVTVPEGLEEVGEGAFLNCTSLESFSFPATITDIYQNAFENCTSLTSLTFPVDGTEVSYRIYGEAFKNCTSLTEISVSNPCMAIGEGAFSGCSSLVTLTVPFVGNARWISTREGLFGYVFGADPYEGGTAVAQSTQYDGQVTAVIPDSLRHVIVTDASRIVYGGFSGCSMVETVTLNLTVFWIDGNAFEGCDHLTIRSYAASQPAGWVLTWNPLNRPVVFGITE